MGYTVKIVGVEKEWEYEDGFGGSNYAYQIQPNGVLRLLTEEDGVWIIGEEVSPTGWTYVSGRRYTGHTDRLGGSEGIAKASKAEGSKALGFP